MNGLCFGTFAGFTAVVSIISCIVLLAWLSRNQPLSYTSVEKTSASRQPAQRHQGCKDTTAAKRPERRLLTAATEQSQSPTPGVSDSEQHKITQDQDEQTVTHDNGMFRVSWALHSAFHWDKATPRQPLLLTYRGFHSSCPGRAEQGELRLCINEWCAVQYMIWEQICGPEADLLCVGVRPFYLHQEFINILICCVLYPPVEMAQGLQHKQQIALTINYSILPNFYYGWL